MPRTDRKLIDAGILMGFLNINDRFHKICRDFFDAVHKGNKIQIVIPAHTFIEVNTKLRKKQRSKSWNGYPSFKMI